MGKEKHGKETKFDIAEYLEEEEIQKLIEAAPTLQKKAFLACMYESGAGVKTNFFSHESFGHRTSKLHEIYARAKKCVKSHSCCCQTLLDLK